MKYVVDTHVLLWFLGDSPKLSDRARSIFLDPASQLVLLAIALAEAVWIVKHGKTNIPSTEFLWDAVSDDFRVEVYPLNRAVIERTIKLSANEMHDRQIVATAWVIQDSGEEVAVLTCDRHITASNLISII